MSAGNNNVFEDRREGGYVGELRRILGHRPLMFVAVPVLIFDGHNRVLLQLRTDDHTWCLPGGYMELDESTIETARREIREETGLEVGTLSLFSVYSGKEFYKEFPNGDQVFTVSVVYFTEDVQGKIRPDVKEGLELEYFSFKDLPADLSSHARRIIEDFWRKSNSRENKRSPL